MGFVDGPSGPDAAAELVSNMIRYSASYELGRGFKWRVSCLSVGGPGATLFFPDAPSRCVSPAWLPFEMFRNRLAPRRVAPQTFRITESRPDAPDSNSSLYSSGFSHQYAARGQDVLQMLVFMWLLPTASSENTVMATGALASSLSARQQQLILGSVADPSYELPGSFAPRGCSTVMDDAVGTFAVAIIARVNED